MIPRREALERLAFLLGGALSTQLTAAVMGQVLNSGTSLPVSEAQTALLAEAADVILPATDTPGAKAARVEQFIVRVMRDCYQLDAQQAFYSGLAKVDEASQAAHGKTFAELTPEQRTVILRGIAKGEPAFFRRLKELTVTGYFISEIGATQALEYLPVPGRFEGDVPWQPGQKAWAIPK